MKKHDCCHECPRCKYLTTCLPNCTGERKHEERVCPKCQRAETPAARFINETERLRALAKA